MLNRSNPVRIVIGLIVRSARLARNRLRLAALLGKGCHCGPMTYIDPAARLSCPANIAIGSHCTIGKCRLYALDRIEVGERAIIGDGVYVCTGSHDIFADDFHLVTAPIVIEDGVWVATGATILPGVRVGRGAVVGAMAVVSKDVPAGAVVVGNPAKIVKTGRSVPAFDPATLASIDVGTSVRRLKAAFSRPG